MTFKEQSHRKESLSVYYVSINLLSENDNRTKSQSIL